MVTDLACSVQGCVSFCVKVGKEPPSAMEGQQARTAHMPSGKALDD